MIRDLFVPLIDAPGDATALDAAVVLALAFGENLLRHVLEAGADLLVMGGYGHGRWREFLLAGAKTPVLFSR